MINQFSVTQFLRGNIRETVRSSVSMEESLRAFAHYTDNVASRMGLTIRVVITDGENKICMEWKHGQGIVFPPPETRIK